MSSVREVGFTLLEAMVALVIVGLVAIAALAAVGAELRGAERAERLIEATVLAEHRMAELELLPRADLAGLLASGRSGAFAEPFGAYSWELSGGLAPGNDRLLDVRVGVGWPGGRFELETRLARAVPVESEP